MSRCPCCLGPRRKGTGGKALYRSGRGVGIGHVCARCLARAFPVVLNVGIAEGSPLDVLTKRAAEKAAAEIAATKRKRRSALIRHIEGEGEP